MLRSGSGRQRVQTISAGGAVYVVKRNGFRIGPTLGVQRTTVGNGALTAASLGAVIARQLNFEGGFVVPQLAAAATAVNGGDVRSSGSFALGIVLPAGRARLVIEPAFAVGFDGGGTAGSLRLGVVGTL